MNGPLRVFPSVCRAFSHTSYPGKSDAADGLELSVLNPCPPVSACETGAR